MPKTLKILVSPLDWGLGHATRMISLLRFMKKQNHELIIGVNELTIDFLKTQFPEAEFHNIPSYNILYSSEGSSFSMLGLFPKILKAKKAEYKWVKQFVKNNQVDLIISDSRFGFRNQNIPCVIISHQLSLPYPNHYLLFGWFAQKVNENWLRKFDQIWVPDFKDHFLSGRLSMNSKMGAYFLNPQSRLQPTEYSNPLGTEYILCILSGPEPQRTKLEELIIAQVPTVDKRVVIVGGKPNKKMGKIELENIIYFNHLRDDEMATYIQNASLVISRSGYSSLMDYYRLSCKRLFLIPTPGQEEQIYLAKQLKKNRVCDYQYQNMFTLKQAILSMDAWKGFHSKQAGQLSSASMVSELLMKLI